MATKLIECPRVALLVRKNLVQEQAVRVFTHEAVLLAVLHGEDAIRADPNVDQSTLPSSKLLPSDEYDRLGSNYGRNPEGHPYVSALFGPRQLGNLRQAMGKSPNDLFADMSLEDEDIEDMEDEAPVDETEKLDVVKLKRGDLLERLNSVKDMDEMFEFDETAKVPELESVYKSVVLRQLQLLNADMRGYDDSATVHELAAVLEAA